jgi:aspartyl-tRNA(Asn)/glutamyl-tRNA(Gln) amidotransferase subunit A
LQAEWQRRLAHTFEDVTVLLTPTVGVPAPTLVEGENLKPGALTRFTNPFNLSGSPALSVPCGFTQAGLPVGLQIVGRHWDEATVLRVGHAYEQATEWHERTAA